jgi:VWFA-related protein
LAPDLRRQDFEVYEDGVKQSITVFRHEDAPVTAGLVVDHSGSMRRKLPIVTAAARTFVNFSSAEDEIFVINFNESVTVGLPDTLPFTNSPDALAAAIANAPATGLTALYDAVLEAQKRLQNGAREKKVLIVISDGGDNSSVHTLAEMLRVASQSSTMVYTLGIFDDSDEDRKPGVLRRLATTTGGEAFFPDRVSDAAAVCERIARDIRNQYTIGYVSTAPMHPGAYRAIRVVAKGPGKSKLFVRTRAGYIAAGEPAPMKADAAK